MGKYLGVFKSSFKVKCSRKQSIFFALILNSIFLIISYYLWNSIYFNVPVAEQDGKEIVFRLMLASSIATAFITNIDWTISADVINGNIILSLIKPLKFFESKLCESFGVASCNFIFNTLPLVIILFIGWGINLDIKIILFFVSIVLSNILMFNLDYLVGLTSFYTESIWGISTIKTLTIGFLAGTIIPINLFSVEFQEFLTKTPFYAICQIPVDIILNNSKLIFNQIFWVIILIFLNKFLTQKCMKNVTINGG